MRRFLVCLAVASLLSCACTTLDARREMGQAETIVEAAVGPTRGLLTADEQTARLKLDELLSGGLSAEEAVQVALLNNARIRAAMISIGVSRADFVQSTLFTNPTLTLSFRLPDGGGLANFETALTQNIAELWLIPARRRTAQEDLDRAILEAARLTAAIVLDVRTAYVRAQRAEQQLHLMRDSLSVADRVVETAQLRQQAGSGSEIDVNLARSQRLDVMTAARNLELAATESRSDLARLLGLSLAPATLTLTDTLPEPGPWTTSPERLQQVSREHRLDLRIADRAVAAAESRLVEERARFLKSVEVGFALERGERRSRGDRKWAADTFYDSLQSRQTTPPNLMPREGETTDVILGPTFGVELPIWDQNQAQIAKADRVYQQAKQLRDALLSEAAQDIHSHLARAVTAYENARFYRDEQLSMVERSAALAGTAYRSGHLSILSVIEAERNLLNARSGYLAAVEHAALASIELERATGRPASELRSLTPGMEQAATQPGSPEGHP